MAKRQQLSPLLPPSSVSNSPSSPRSSADSYGTDDSIEQQQQQQQHYLNGGAHRAASNKSPILVKYNYYDYNGERQENHELLLVAANQSQNKQRQVSPAFRQNKQMEQIVLGQAPSSNASSSPVSPVSDQSTATTATMLLARRYNRSSYEQRCLRCKKTVYQMDKVGPLKDFSFYHQNCFKCLECGTKLTLKTYFNSQHSSSDLEVYCHRHCPKSPAGRLDNQSVGIRAALNAPKVFEPMLQVAGPSAQFYSGDCFQEVPMQNSGHNHQRLASNNNNNLGSRALHTQHSIRQTKLEAIYQQSQVDKKISQFLNRRLEFLEPKQKLLEMRHREEEEQLFRAFELKWRQEEQQIRDQIRDEWQLELNKLVEKYKRQLSSLSSASSSSTSNAMAPSRQAEHLPLASTQADERTKQQVAANIAAAAAAAARAAKQQQARNAQQQQQPQSQALTQALPLPLPLPQTQTQTQTQTRNDEEHERLIELERINLEKNMTIKLDRKKETLKRKLKEFERHATAELVEKQSHEMLALISMKLEEFKEEQKSKIGSDLEQFEALETLANQLGDSLQFGERATPSSQPTMCKLEIGQTNGRAALQPPVVDGGQAKQLKQQQQQQAPPKPLSKWQLYNSEQADEVFKDIDARAINIAQEDQQTFTDLVHHLTRKCLTDVEKARAIFRWITVKNLNTMQFDSSIEPDTPFGLLRGIKQGSESYHVLFKRLCSYAGLHCVVIKGYSKSAGYQPGVPFEGNRFRNSWNAVYVAGAWRFVQCNWGARHLVSVAVMQDKNSSTTESKSNLGRRGGSESAQQVAAKQFHRHHHHHQLATGLTSPSAFSTGSSSSSSCQSTGRHGRQPHQQQQLQQVPIANGDSKQAADSLRYEYDDHYFLTDPDEFIYEFFPLSNEWQLLSKSVRPITLAEFEQLPFVRSLFFKYGLYFAQPDIRSVLYTDSSGATTIKIGMPTHMIPNLIFHYNLKYFNSDQEQHDGVSLKRFVMQSAESGGQTQLQQQPKHGSDSTPLSNIVSFRVHVPENGAYILDIFANSTTPTQYITGDPMKFKSVCKFKIVAKNLRTVMIPLPDCASGEFGPMKATRLFGIIPLTHENGLISLVAKATTNNNDKMIISDNNNNANKRLLEIQFRMTRPLLDFMASLHKNDADERVLSKWIKIFIDGDIVTIAIKFQEDGQYGLDIYTRDQQQQHALAESAHQQQLEQPKKQLLTHCCKYLINVRTSK